MLKKLGKKDYYFDEYVKFYNILKKYSEYIKEIVKIQGFTEKEILSKIIYP